MSDSTVEKVLPPEIQEASKEYVDRFFSTVSDDFDLVAFLRTFAYDRVGREMLHNPDEFIPRPPIKPQEVWQGPRPSGPKEFLKRKIVLPSLPQVMVEIQSVINDPDSSATDLAKAISKDPKLVASILRLANSAMYSFRTEVDTPSRAVALLGFKQVSTLALGAASLSLFKRPKQSVLDIEKFWKHSIACGVIAQEIARKGSLGDPERFFVSGLLHDIGLYIIYESDPNLALTLENLANSEEMSFYGAEVKLLGFNHAILGGTILKEWNFPQPLVIAAAGHHDLDKIDKYHDAGVVHVAEFIARALGFDLCLSPVLGFVSESAWDKIGITVDQFKDILPGTLEMIETVFEILTDGGK